MKKISKYIGTALLSALIMTNISYAAAPIKYDSFKLDGKVQKIALANVNIDSYGVTAPKGDVPPLVINSRTLVPAKLVSEKLGASVAWDGKTEEVTIKNDDKTIVLKIKSPTATVNGASKELPDKVSPIIVDSRTMVPLKFLANEFDLDINYDAKTNTTTMVTKNDSISLGNDIFASNTSAKSDEDILSSLNLEGVTQVETTGSSEQLPDIKKPDPKPQVPSEPVVITPAPEPAPVVTQPVVPTVQPSTPQVSYQLIQNSMDNEVFTINNVNDLAYTSFFLSDPHRLVIDIPGASMNPVYDANRLYSGSAFITEMNSFYHTSENKLRVTLKLAANTSQKEIGVSKNAGMIQVAYTSQKPKNSNITYASDRINSVFDLRLKSGYNINSVNFDSFSNTLEVSVPSDIAMLKEEVRNIEDRNISTIQIGNTAGNNTVKFKLKDRTTYQIISNGGSGVFSIKFIKGNRPIPSIVVDPGHGAKDPGAVNSKVGIHEKTLNLQISEKFAARLKQEGYNVTTTRDTDVFIELVQRAATANDSDADLFISIHHNATGSTAANGIETLYYPSEDNKALAQIFQTEMVNASGAANRRIIPRSNLAVLNRTKMPATLLELGYMTNAAEVANLMDDAYQNKMVEGMVNAVNKYFRGY